MVPERWKLEIELIHRWGDAHCCLAMRDSRVLTPSGV